MFAGSPEGPVQPVGIAQVKGQVEFAFGVHLPGPDRIKTFRGLPVSRALLGTDFSRPVADGVGLEVMKKAVTAFFPDFEFRFLLENTNEYGRIFQHVMTRKICRCRFRQGHEMGRQIRTTGAGCEQGDKPHRQKEMKFMNNRPDRAGSVMMGPPEYAQWSKIS